MTWDDMSPAKPRPFRRLGESVLSGQSDERLVTLFRAGHDAAFEAIVRRYRRPLLAYCRRFVDEGRSEDVVQQAFLNAYKAFPSAERDLEVRPWLYRIVHNASLDALRSASGEDLPLPEDVESAEAPEQSFERSQKLRETVAGLQKLPEHQREAIVLRELEGRSHEEIAIHIGVTKGAVRQLIHRARGSLRAGVSVAFPLAWVSSLVRAPRAEAFAARLPDLASSAAVGGGMVKSAVMVAAVVGVGGAAAAGTVRHVTTEGISPRITSVVLPAPSLAASARSTLGRALEADTAPGDRGRPDADTGERSSPVGERESSGASREADGKSTGRRVRTVLEPGDGPEQTPLPAPAPAEHRELDDDTSEPLEAERDDDEAEDSETGPGESDERDGVDDGAAGAPAAAEPSESAGEHDDAEDHSPATADETGFEQDESRPGPSSKPSASEAASPPDRDRSED